MKRTKILFVCLGNICRSPAAEGVLKNLVGKLGLDSHFEIDSAGILSFHQGKPADARMRDHARKRGIDLTSRSRPVKAPDDFEHFDLLLAMDKRNLADLKELDCHQRFDQKIKLFSEYFQASSPREVPDPYYGGPEGFEVVLDLVEEGARGLLLELGHG
jgi:protein-tyrosine phosphatase